MSRLDSLGARAFGDVAGAPLEDKVADLQARIGGELPLLLTTIISEFSGSAIVFDKEVSYHPIAASKWTRPDGRQSLEMLFGLNEGKSGLAAQFDRYEGRLPDGVVPVGEGPGGNLVCVVVHGPRVGNIYFWDHENEHPISGVESKDFANMYLIANSFDDFIDALAADDPQSEQDDGIIDAWISDDL